MTSAKMLFFCFFIRLKISRKDNVPPHTVFHQIGWGGILMMLRKKGSCDCESSTLFVWMIDSQLLNLKVLFCRPRSQFEFMKADSCSLLQKSTKSVEQIIFCHETL
ncbi:hypothetical protein H5410_059652 [Solanum commersonii]|uniref:Uncharacterized protein n=1 Tax=Solanum commersonii TaxID=4109 RepID=A0A9J5W444_SOLCO|nr:hypothetical protein H5410_059652 [Solanum commersonii]